MSDELMFRMGRRQLPRLADRSSIWIYIRRGEKRYAVRVRRTVPIGEALILERPRSFEGLGGNLSELLISLSIGSANRLIWHPYEDFLPIKANVALLLDQPPNSYSCQIAPMNSKQVRTTLGRICYTGPAPTTGHGVNQFELQCGPSVGNWVMSCDRMAEASHLICLAHGLVARAESTIYLCEIPSKGEGR